MLTNLLQTAVVSNLLTRDLLTPNLAYKSFTPPSNCPDGSGAVAMAILSKEFGKHYEMNRKMRSGARCVLMEATHKGCGDKYAVKIIKKQGRSLNSEMKSLMRLSHTNCVQLHEAYEENKDLYLVMDLIEGTTLAEEISYQPDFSEARVADIMSQIFKGLQHMHENEIVHGNLVEDHIILSCDDMVKIVGFGNSSLVDEIVAASGNRGPAQDMLMAGRILDRMLNAGLQEKTSSKKRFSLFRNPLAGLLGQCSKSEKKVSADALDLAARLLEQDHRKRPSAAACLRHPWMMKMRSTIESHPHVGDCHAAHKAFQLLCRMDLVEDPTCEKLKEMTSRFELMSPVRGELIADKNDLRRNLYLVGSGNVRVIVDGVEMQTLSTGGKFLLVPMVPDPCLAGSMFGLLEPHVEEGSRIQIVANGLNFVNEMTTAEAMEVYCMREEEVRAMEEREPEWWGGLVTRMRAAQLRCKHVARSPSSDSSRSEAMTERGDRLSLERMQGVESI
eukprot:765521-Hanusia_phi.AAC.9